MQRLASNVVEDCGGNRDLHRLLDAANRSWSKTWIDVEYVQFQISDMLKNGKEGSRYIAACFHGDWNEGSGLLHVRTAPEETLEWNWFGQNFGMEVPLAWMMVILFLGISVAHVAHILSKRHALQEACAIGFHMLKNAGGMMRNWVCLRDKDNARVTKLSAQRRSAQALAAFRILAPISWFALLPSVRRFLNVLLARDINHFDSYSVDDKKDIRVVFNDSELIPLIFLAFISAYFIRWPHHAKPRSLDTANVIFAVVWIWKTTTLVNRIDQDTSSFHFHQAWIIFCRSFQFLVFGNAPLASILHVIWVASDIYVFPSLLSNVAKPTLPGTGDDALPFYIFRQTVLGVLAVGTTWAFELSRSAEVKAVCAMEQSTIANSQVVRVLSAMCDSVITLDSSLLITGGPANGLAKLQSLLMLPSPEICNKSFIDFVSSEDQERFRCYTGREADSMSKSGEMNAQAQSCHLHFKDMFGLPVAVQIFCSAHVGHDRQPMYFLGIREDADAGLRAERQQEALANSPVADIPAAQIIGNPDEFLGHRGDRNFEIWASDKGKTNSRRSARSRSSRSDDGSDDGSGASNSRGTPGNLPDPVGLTVTSGTSKRVAAKWNKGFHITPSTSIEVFIREGIHHMNCDPQNIRCCSWHHALFRSNSILKQMMGSACDQSFTSDCGKQCVECQMVCQDDASVCPICGEENLVLPDTRASL